MKIWLDDTREPPDNTWFIARTIGVCFEPLERGTVTDLSLDNDLGPNQAEGYNLVTWMVENGHWPTTSCKVHSQNIVASQRMLEDINRYFRRVL